MLKLKGYELGERLYGGERTAVWRAVRSADGVPVIVKVPRRDAPPEERAKLRQEFEIARELAQEISGVVRPLFLELPEDASAGSGAVLILEDGGGMSLAQFLEQGVPDIDTALEIAVQIASILGEVHARGVVHKDVKPHNIILEPRELRIQLTDFGISSRLSREHAVSGIPGRLQGTLAYVSPEQTGRMNRLVDNRSDFYSLGVTLYELVTGLLPFPHAADALELIHHHIAVPPRSPLEHRADVPPSLAAVMMKLLAKNAEDRYQSAYGLFHDLDEIRTCRAQFGNGTAPELVERFEQSFVPGRQDVSDRFQIPQKLYGREEESAQMLQSFQRCARGRSELLLVAGFSGIGKSALVNEVQKPITERKGNFVAGKFDQFQRDLPYSALLQAFGRLIRRLLGDEQSTVEIRAERLRECLGQNGRVLTDVLPELQWLIGEQPPVVELPPAESENRFNAVFRDFVRALAGEEHPLAIFLDDLQWADASSLKLIRTIITDTDTNYFLIIGAYRDNEVDAAHPLTALMERFANETEQRLTVITLAPLNRETLKSVVAETLHVSSEEARGLADLVHAKTGGNPFFVNEFLRTLHDKALVQFDAGSGRWGWDLERIAAEGITDNVVELMADRIRDLPPETGRALQTAACIGNVFELRDLARFLEREIGATARLLREALNEGLILALDQNYNYAESEELDVSYRFLHDRVQQAAYELIDAAERPALHLRIGREMLTFGEQEIEDDLFTLVNHLNEGRSLLDDLDERRRLAELNLRAGRKALASTAYASAARFLRFGVEMLGEYHREEDNRLCLDLYLSLADAESLRPNFEEAERLIELLFERATEPLDQVRAGQIRTRILNARSRIADSLTAGLENLGRLGVHIPQRPSAVRVLREFGRTLLVVMRRGRRYPLRAKQVEAPVILAALNVLDDTVSVAYQQNANVLAIIICKIVQLTYRHGLSRYAPFGIAGFGYLNLVAFERLKAARWYVDLALQLLEAGYGRESIGRVNVFAYAFVGHRHSPWARHFTALENGGREALVSGDVEYGMYGFLFRANHAVFAHESLAELAERFAMTIDQADKLEAGQSGDPARVWAQFVDNLRGRADDPAVLRGRYLDHELAVEHHLANGYKGGAAWTLCARSMLRYLFDREGDNAGDLAAALEFEESLANMVVLPYIYMFQILATLDNFRKESRRERRRRLKIYRKARRFLGLWARGCPQNYEHLLLWAEATHLLETGREEESLAIFDAAVRAARRARSNLGEGLVLEASARAYESCGREVMARACVEECRAVFRSFGAEAKVEQLEERYAAYFRSKRGGGRSNRETSSSEVTMLDVAGGVDLDLGAVMEAVGAISSEVRFKPLLERLTHSLLENSGADRCFILLSYDDKLLVHAAGRRDADSGIRIELREAEAPAEKLSAGVADVRSSRQMKITAGGETTEVAAPILYQGRLDGVVILHTALPFQDAHAGTLDLLCAQAAISLDTARLYEELEGQVRSRTRELRRSRREMYDIMDNVSQGLLVLDRHGRLGNEYSRSAAEILERDDLGGLSFYRLFPDANVRRSSAALVEQLFENGFMSAAMFDRANSLKGYRYLYVDADRKQAVKILDFGFSRMLAHGSGDSGAVQKLMVTIEDRTRDYQLERELERRKVEQESRVEKLYEILRLEPAVFSGFLNEGREGVEFLRGRIADRGVDGTENRTILEDCLRAVHALKGNAGVMNLDTIARRAHTLEDRLEDLCRRLDENQEDYRLDEDGVEAVVEGLADLEEELRDGDRVFQRVLNIKQALGGNEGPTFESLEEYFRTAVERAARQAGKDVRFEFLRRPGVSSADASLIDDIKNPITQLLRNSVGHGIETDEQRRRASKELPGTVLVEVDTIYVTAAQRLLHVTVRDNGRGLDPVLIKERAVAVGLIDAGDADSMSAEKVYRLLFRSGFSTAENVTELSGRGVGLDIVRSELLSREAKISIQSEVGKFTKFMIRLPA